MFLAAFIAYEASLYAVSYLLPSREDAFSLPIISQIFLCSPLSDEGTKR